MFFALTGTIYLGWAGSAIIGGLYWKRATANGAWAAAIIGVTLAYAGWYLTYNWESSQQLMSWVFAENWNQVTQSYPGLLGDKCPVNAQWLYFLTVLTTVLVFILVSLMDNQVFNMDQLLHRGEYAFEQNIEAETSQERSTESQSPEQSKSIFSIGKEFTFGDKVLFFGSYAYIFVFFAVFLFGTFYMLTNDISDQAWGEFWWYFCVVILLMTAAVTAVVTIGGLKNLRELYEMLKNIRRDEDDDGTVVGNQSLSDLKRDQTN